MIDTCPNCGSVAPQRYCPSCGQRQGARLLRTRDIARDLVEDNLSLESRLPRTLLSLLFRPGRLTRDYAEGRIARYVQPVRLYIASSLFFFLTLSFIADFDLLWSALRADIEAAPEGSYVLLRTDLNVDDVPSWLRAPVAAWERQVAELNALAPREGIRVLYDATIGAVPPIVFLLVPGFALVLKLLYRRRFYAEHFIFLLHFHSLTFVLAALALLVRETWVSVLVLIACAVWLYAALRVNYAEREESRERHWRTGLKYGTLLAAYWLALSVTVVLVMFVAILSI